jgi:hypothetical protein
MPDHYKKINTLVARPRVLTEIAFGIWKGRFPLFRCARMNIRSADDLQKLLGYIEATLVIHNMFITTSRSEDLFIQVVSIAMATLRRYCVHSTLVPVVVPIFVVIYRI